MSTAIEPGSQPADGASERSDYRPERVTLKDRPWLRWLALALVALWAVWTALAFTGGYRVVPTQQLQQDLTFGRVTSWSTADSVRWDSGQLTGSAVSRGGDTAGLVLYRTSNNPFDPVLVASPQMVDDGTAVAAHRDAWDDTDGDVFRQLDRRPGGANVHLADRPAWFNGLQALPVLAALLLIVSGPAPRRGNRWFWFWIVFLTPGTLGAVAYLWWEHVSSRPVRRSRRSGLTGFVGAICATFMVAVTYQVVSDVLGVTTFPR